MTVMTRSHKIPDNAFSYMAAAMNMKPLEVKQNETPLTKRTSSSTCCVVTAPKVTRRGAVIITIIVLIVVAALTTGLVVGLGSKAAHYSAEDTLQDNSTVHEPKKQQIPSKYKAPKHFPDPVPLSFNTGFSCDHYMRLGLVGFMGKGKVRNKRAPS